MPTSQVQFATGAALEAYGVTAIGDVDSGQQALILRAINAAVEIISNAKDTRWHQSDEFASIIRGPTSLTLGLTNGLKTITSADIAANSWMKGQTVIIEGDPVPNRIVRASSGAEAGATLLMPYLGSTGNISCSLYNDVIELPSDFMRFKGNNGDLCIVGKNAIKVVDSRRDAGLTASDNTTNIGDPDIARIVTKRSSNGSIKPHLQLNKLPSQTLRIYSEYWHRIPKVVTLDDDRNDLVPMEFENSVLAPLVVASLASITSGVTINQGIVAAGMASAQSILADIGDVSGGIGGTTTESGIHE